MSRLTIRVNPKTGKNFLPRHIREEGFVGVVEVLVNALTVTFIKPGSDLASIDKSLDLIKQDIALRRERALKEDKKVEKRSTPERLPTRREEFALAGQHPIFNKYTRAWLSEVTSFSKGYLSRVATGKTPLTHSFIERVSFKLQQPAGELFLPEATAEEVPKPIANSGGASDPDIRSENKSS